MLTSEQIKEFKELYKDHFGKEISDAKAEIYANQLVTLVKKMVEKKPP